MKSELSSGPRRRARTSSPARATPELAGGVLDAASPLEREDFCADLVLSTGALFSSAEASSCVRAVVSAAMAATRQRDVFPLPHFEAETCSMNLSRVVRRRFARKSRTLSLANRGIDALNWMAGAGPRDHGLPVTAMQKATLDYVGQQFRNVGPPPDGLEAEGALRALLGTTKVYCDDRPDLKPYNKSKVAWPPVGSQPLLIERHCEAADGESLRAWRSRLLRCEDEHARLLDESGLRRPYSDPLLMSTPSGYCNFVQELAARGLVDYLEE